MSDDGKRVRPFLKWAGNKFAIVEHIRRLLPEGKRLVEPFVGSGAPFLNTGYRRYLLCDNNPDLIHLYQVLKEEGKAFIDDCAELFAPENNTERTYYRLRDTFNASEDPRERARLFVYLNRHGYNGLCRYSKRGGFNVPFGSYKEPLFPRRAMEEFHRRSKQVEFRCQDFAECFAQVRKGDVVYCDPPYVPLSTTAYFSTYSQKFEWDLQQRLAELAAETAARGIPVLVSNHDTEETRWLYRGARHVESIQVRRNISCNSATRGLAAELLVLY